MLSVHKPVLLKEVSSVVSDWFLVISNNRQTITSNQLPVFLDCTLGGAGHAKAITEILKGKLTLMGLDRDPQAIERGRESLKGCAERVILEVEDFRRLDSAIEKHGIKELDLILLDLGLSSDEFEHSGKGFSFQRDEPLLMTMGDMVAYSFTAKDIVNGWKEEDIANVIFGYGEDRYARRIAKAIVVYRDKAPINTSAELAEIVKNAVPGFARRSKIHPATKTFQALRIAVNDELNALKQGLNKGYEHLRPGGMMMVIAFHSLEDRIVKDFFKNKEKSDQVKISKKPNKPSAEEVAENPRSRSAKLRILQKNV